MEHTTSAAVAGSQSSLKIINVGAIAATFIAIFIVGVIGNSVVIYILFRKRRTWNITTTYLFNLAVADAVFVCTLPLWAAAYLNNLEWNFGVFACKLVGTVTSLNMYASIFFLTAMSVDRRIAVVHATTINNTRSSVVARIMCVVVWGLAFAISIPRLIYTDVRGTPANVSSFTVGYNATLPTLNAPPPVLRCGFQFPNPNKRLFMGLSEFIQAAVGFIIPMTIICACYIRIVGTVRKKLISKRVRKERVAVLAAIIITAFFVCWLPLQLMTLYSALAGWWKLFAFDKDFFWRLHPPFLCLAYANSCINPFIYAFTATNFKNNVKDVCGTNLPRCREAKNYKMTLVKEEKRAPATPQKSCEHGADAPFVDTLHGTETTNTKKTQRPNEIDVDFSESLRPQGKTHNKGELGARGPPECQHLAIEDTTSGIYYEYFSSPTVLCRTPDMQDHEIAHKTDGMDHREQSEISESYSHDQSIRI